MGGATILHRPMWIQLLCIQTIILRRMKQGLLFNILGEDWKYISTSCSCQGRSQHEIYRNANITIKHYFKTNKYSINNEPQKDISEVEADIKDRI